ncbi:MAG: FadR family transcriptional regulator [Solirubrobacterales bacterium]|nr:FadR family transcriptional regulator [Solirubrobacterales bacterium]
MSRLHRLPLRALIGQIVGGEYVPGDRLPREEDLAATFWVSRGVVREIVRALEERGLVVVRHGVGAIVADRARWNVLDPQVLPAILRGPDATARIIQTIEHQRLIEGRLAELAAQRLDGAAAQTLELSLRRLRESVDAPLMSVFRPALAEVHRTLIVAANHPMLAITAIPVSEALAGLDEPPTVPSLARAVAAILNGRPVAARSRIDEHLRGLEARLVGER